MKNETMFGFDDGLLMNEDVGTWSDFKYRLIQLYCHLFTLGMKGKWGKLVYVDLYSGSGQSRVKGNGQILLGSPLIALSLDIQFDQYVFCEEDEAKLLSLKERVAKRFPSATVKFIGGDCNQMVQEVCRSIPAGSLCLCFVDPYDLGIKFETIRLLSTITKMDFLCLLASHMDGSRNQSIYSAENTKIDLFLGSPEWRKDWAETATQRQNFGQFLAKRFAKSMEGLGYLPTPPHKMKEIKTDGRNVALYHLALFSKHARAYDYWREVLKYATPQRGLFEEEV